MALKCGDKGFMCFGKCKDMLGLDVNYFFGNPCVESDIEIFASLSHPSYFRNFFQIYSTQPKFRVFFSFSFLCSSSTSSFWFDYYHYQFDIKILAHVFTQYINATSVIREEIRENGIITLEYREKPITYSESRQLYDDYYSKSQKIISDLLSRFTYTHSEYRVKYYELTKKSSKG